MPIASWLRTPRIRRGLAASIVVVAAGGLVLFRAEAQTSPYKVRPAVPVAVNDAKAVTFHGDGLHGAFAVSHGKVLASAGQELFATVDVTADTSPDSTARAPLSLAIVLDTSGSMMGEKIEDAKLAVTKLVSGMRDDDEIAFVRYASDAELVQPLSTVGRVRQSLIDKIESVEAGGGTAIPKGMQAGLLALQSASSDRVRRLVLVSDGLDASRSVSEGLARSAFNDHEVVSSLGIGLDFDSAYMGALAEAGHGNYGFVKDPGALEGFLKRELDESATTRVRDVTVRLDLPPGIRLKNAYGAEVSPKGDGSAVEISVGSMFSGDSRRVVLALSSSLEAGDARSLQAKVDWRVVGGGAQTAEIPTMVVLATRDQAAVDASRDGTVLAAAASVMASKREIEAASAYERGDTTTAGALIQQNLDLLLSAKASAPPPAASALSKQYDAYAGTMGAFRRIAPSSVAGKALPKAAATADVANISRSAY